MIITTDKESPHYNSTTWGTIVELDGKRVNKVIEADDNDGWVLIHTGLISQDGELVTEKLYGKVKFILPKGFKQLFAMHKANARSINLLEKGTHDKYDLVVEANRALLLKRSQLGLVKYGVSLAEANLSRREHLQHALEEALDLANYLQAEIMRLDGLNNGNQETNRP